MAAKLGGGGSSKYVVESNADINVTPFVDIMLVLLIIFMVSIPPATISIKLDMPPPTHTADPHPEKPTFIQILKNGDIFIVDQKVNLEDIPSTLGATLSKAHPERGDPRTQMVFIRADADVHYEQFMDVMNSLQKSGFLKIGLINEDIA